MTLAHLLVSAWWASRGSPHGSPGPAVDARFFDAVLFAVGTLHGVLFLASATTGLPHPRGVAWVAVFDAIVAMALAATRPTTRGDVVASASPPPRTPLRIVAGVLQIAGALALATLAVSWLRVAARSLHVSGSDAAHYHVPHAVNLALGTSPFDLLPTPHLYPMGTSLLGAWFILPFSDPLLIDVAMLACAALLAASLARAFSAVTGRPGLAWTPWLLLALLSPPLFQLATLFSSDLSFAAAFAAAAAQLLVLGARTPPTIDTRDAIGLGLAFGLLCGVKTTGAPAAVLLLAVAVAGWAVGRWRRHAPLAGAAAEPQPARRTAFALLAIGLAAWLAGGGAWLVRNQVRYGSPIAPSGLQVFGVTIFPGETIAESASYYSVAGDLARPGGYPLGARLSYFVRRWLGPVAGPTALLVVLLLGDVATTRWRRQAPVERDLRLALIVGFAAVTVVFLWLLVHAPWTSLDWTDGLALRYALPILVGAAFVAYLGLFPRQFAWYDDPVTAGAGGAILAGLAVTIFLRSRAALPASLTRRGARVGHAVARDRGRGPRRRHGGHPVAGAALDGRRRARRHDVAGGGPARGARCGAACRSRARADPAGRLRRRRPGRGRGRSPGHLRGAHRRRAAPRRHVSEPPRVPAVPLRRAARAADASLFHARLRRPPGSRRRRARRRRAV